MTADSHEHRFDLQLGPNGHGAIFGNYEGYIRRCKCGEFADDYLDYLDGFHECPVCGASHRILPSEGRGENP